MSRATKWKLDKTKVKVVFRLQFHATHIPQTGWNNLFISLVPGDSGKVSAKTNKANVRNGSCKWSDPIYETTRLLQDTKTKQHEEKIYKLLVAMGTSRSSVLGEASINLSDYVDALKPTTVQLPLQGSDSGAILHVTVQLLTSKTGFREFEQQREVSERGLQANTDHDSGKVSPGDVVVCRTDKVHPKVKFKPEPKELPLLEEHSGISEEYTDSASGFDGSSNTSERFCAEKHESSSSREIESVKTTVSGDHGSVSSAQSPSTDKESAKHLVLVSGSSGWVRQWGAENSTDDGIAHEENSRLRGALEAADLTIHDLRQEISSLRCYADDIGVETQNLTKRLASDISADQELVKEVSLLKSECSRLKDDLLQLKNLKMKNPIPRTVDVDQCRLMQDVSLGWMKGLSLLENKVREFQEKVHPGFDGKDSTILQTEFEALFSIVQDLKQETKDSICQLDVFSNGKIKRNIGGTSSSKTDNVLSDTGLGVELCHPEGVLLPGLLASSTGSVDASSAMQGEIFKLLRELDESKAERECLVRKMDQMECYYEALIQELEENQKQILGELQNLRNEHSTCIYTVSSTKAQMEAMHQEMNNELLQLAEERCNLDTINKELERRALSSEAALKRAKLNYSIAVNQLQKDLEVLSLQVHSMYETNENLIRRAFSEASQPLLPGCQDAVPNDLDKVSDTEKFMLSHNHSMIIKNQHCGSDTLLEDLKRTIALQEQLYVKTKEELHEMHLANIYLDVFSVTLHEALVEATVESGLVEAEIHEFSKQLELLSKTNETLKLKQKGLTDEVRNLREEKGTFVSKYNDLTLENEKLDSNLKSIVNEKVALSEKIGELEILLTDYRNYKNNYEDCNAEKVTLANLLEQTIAEKGSLLNEISLVQGELTSMKNKVNEEEQLQNIIVHFCERLENLVACDNEQVDCVLSCSKTEERSLEFEKVTNIILRLEECQQKLRQKNLLLVKENENLLNECDSAKLSLAKSKSEVEDVKQKFQSDIVDMVNKLNASTSVAEKLQKDLEVVGDRLKLSSEAEEKYAQMTHDVLSDFTTMDTSLQELSSKNTDLAAELMSLRSVTDELEGEKLNVDSITQENLRLTEQLNNVTNDSSMLTLELNKLKETVVTLEDELSILRGIRDQLNTDVFNLNTQLKEREEMLSNHDQQKAEISQLKQQLLEMESEKTILHHKFLNFEERLQKAEEGSSVDIEHQLLDLLALVIAADVTCTAVLKQYQDNIEVLSLQLIYSNENLLKVKNQNVEHKSRIEDCLASKEIYGDENVSLLSTLEDLRSESECLVSLNKDLEHANSVTASELKQYKTKNDILETMYATAKTEHNFEVEQLKCLLGSCQKESDHLIMSNEELEIRFLVLKVFLNEMSAHCKFQEGCKEELTMLQKQCSELNRKLSEQVLKTEEFKNLSLHLKELKDKDDAGHLQVRENREAEGSSVAMQESLRIAFIKEQYETKLHEVRLQLSISKKHGEEMLWKLQDALGELENKKKYEAFQLKRNEELMLKITELEAELQSLLSENRERLMACEQLKAELDCSVMSLDCCKEEKKQLMASLQESNNEKSRLADEIELMREQVQNLEAFLTGYKNSEDECHAPQKGLRESSDLENSAECFPLRRKIAQDEGTSSTSSDDQGNHSSQNVTLKIGSEDGEFMNLPGLQDSLVTKPTENLTDVTKSQTGIPHHHSKHVTLFNDQLKVQNLLSSMDRLQKELERMKNENSPVEDENTDELDGEGSQREQTYLEEVTKELGNLSSLYNGSSRNGNSVERVLALELELAESLQAKKSTIQFQSSFLKVHSDEAAVFQSFRDINELIKDMLQMKERCKTMESELKEMHERYSKLSLDFAEVEGERQKLTMTLKNVRSSKSLLRQPQSSTLDDLSP